MTETTADFFRQVFMELKRGRPVAVALVTRRRGSGPRQPGAKLVLDSDGRIWGTVGGGDFEHHVLQRAREVFNTGRPERVSHEMRNEDAAAAGMMCGGWIEALVDRFSPEDQPLGAVLARAQTAMNARESCLLVITMTGSDLTLKATWDLIITGTSIRGKAYPGELFTTWSTPSDMDELPMLWETPAGSLYAEWIRPPEAAYIFGAGHIGEELAPLCRRAGFWTVILDDRSDFASRERFPDAHKVVVLNRFASILDRLPFDSRTYIVIVTRGHLHDREVLEQVLATPARYVGMIGSPKKWATIRAALEQAGWPAQSLARVHCPVGLAIGAETPAELALCIAAEMVAVRRGVLPPSTTS